jgi:DNA repair protein RadC
MRLRELHISYRPVAGAPAGPRPRLDIPADCARFVAPLVESEAVEVFGLLLLNTKNEPIAWHVLSRGSLDSTLVHARDVVKAACLGNAAAVITVHNHPSGDPTPSADDRSVTDRLRVVLSFVGIDLLDSIVIGENGRYSSMKELGRL